MDDSTQTVPVGTAGTSAPENYPCVEFTRATAEPADRILTKRFSLDADGKLLKKSAPHGLQGRVTRIQAPLDTLLDGASANACNIYGVCEAEEAPVNYVDALGDGEVARSKKFFSYRSRAVLMIDADPNPDAVPPIEPLTAE